MLLTLAALLAPSALGVVALGTLVANISVVLTSFGTASALIYWRGDVLRAARTAVTIGVGMGAGDRGRAVGRPRPRWRRRSTPPTEGRP